MHAFTKLDVPTPMIADARPYRTRTAASRFGDSAV